MRIQKQSSLLSHMVSILFLPFNVTVVIPTFFLLFFKPKYGWGVGYPLLIMLMVIGSMLIVLGLLLVAITVRHFATRGKGTLAPWDPPKKLVVSGPYQYSRNPMISGVACTLLGEMIVFGSLPLFLWFTFFTIINYLYFIIGEEPLLTKKFGEEYLEYKRHVPRLFPRRTPWKKKM